MLRGGYQPLFLSDTTLTIHKINLQENSGWSALVFAADRGHEDLVKMLLHHGGNVLTYDEVYYVSEP